MNRPEGRIDWPGLMRLGLGALRLSPERFWSMTPRELAAAIGAARVAAQIDGRTITLRLTLGALAELEAELDAGGLVALAERFESGRFSAGDLMALIAAGVRGAGGAASAQDVGRMEFEGGATGAARLGGRLLAATFAPLDGAAG